MYSRSTLAIKYFKYLLQARNGKGHGIHSPFIYEFTRKVLNDHSSYEDYRSIETLRSQLLNDSRILEVNDMGAGSVVTATNKRSVASIARNAAKPKKYAQLLYRISRYFQPALQVELGTSLGISACYLATGAPESRVVTMEGAGSIAGIARNNFTALGLRNVRLIEGNFDTSLPALLADEKQVDLAFIDGNHRKEPTLNYFTQLAARAHSGTVIILDDIHWSRDMEMAWDCVKSDERVTCSIDLFFIGIVFFRSEFREKQHFTIRF